MKYARVLKLWQVSLDASYKEHKEKFNPRWNGQNRVKESLGLNENCSPLTKQS